jgi:hypothetical protein
MARVVGFVDLNIQATIEDASGGGAAIDPGAPRNDPAINPEDNLDKIISHLDMFQYELLVDTVVTINHTALAGSSFSLGNSSPHYGITVNNNRRVSDLTLYTHSLGYKPICFVQYNDINLLAGTEVQRDADGRYRLVSMYVTNTIVGLREISFASNVALNAASRDYRVAICRNPEVDVDLPLFGSVGGHIVLGRGKINTANKYARKPDTGDPVFKLDDEQTIDVRGGRARTVSGGVTTTETGYTGSFTGGGYTEITFG